MRRSATVYSPLKCLWTAICHDLTFNGPRLLIKQIKKLFFLAYSHSVPGNMSVLAESFGCYIIILGWSLPPFPLVFSDWSFSYLRAAPMLMLYCATQGYGPYFVSENVVPTL